MIHKVPYLTVAVTNKCNFRCNYCSPDGEGGMGEGFGTNSEDIDVDDLCAKLKIAQQEGISKIRLTGGEPLIAKGTIDVMKFLDTQTDMEYALATNGSMIHKYIEDLSSLKRLDLRISLDAVEKNMFASICGVSERMYDRTMNSIRETAKRGILNRLAMVVTEENLGQVESLLDLTSELGINLKLFDMYSTTCNKGQWGSLYTPLERARNQVKKRSKHARQITYTRFFGIPSLEYELKNSSHTVRIKDSTSGTRYHDDFCDSCSSLPCQEGLYTIFYSSDKQLIPCRLSPVYLDASHPKMFQIGLRYLIDVFQDSYHENKFWEVHK
ncbi:radical SAM protein [Candidatus Woesearchaeota archaeon]|nr:radical SAM protein [Candidatus Woesearchaeota archaeon]